MFDLFGVEIKKGDLLLNMVGHRAGFYTGVCVAVELTKKQVIIGEPRKRWSGSPTRKPTVMPRNCVVVNHMWDAALQDKCKTRYNHPKISDVVYKFNITPNRDTRQPTEIKNSIEKNDDINDLSNI